MKHGRFILYALPFIALMMVLWPTQAHAAGGLLDVFTTTLQAFLAIMVSLLQAFQKMLAELILYLVNLLTAVLMNPNVNYGGPAVYVVWKIFRDMCNSLFIVFFVVIAFSTIFNSIWKGASTYYYRNALMSVITAAVLINFSLPIGQTIVWAGNQAGVLVSGLMTGTNIKGQMFVSLRLGARTENKKPSFPSSVIPDEVTPLNQQGAVQRAVTESWTGEAKEAYEECIRTNQSPGAGGCIGVAARINATKVGVKLDEEAGNKSLGAWAWSAAKTGMGFYADAARNPMINTAVTAVGGSAASALLQGSRVAESAMQVSEAVYDAANTLQSLQPKELTLKLASTFINILLMMLMILSFLCIIAFMVLRLPIIWMYLATSAIAFFMIAVPGSDRFKKWWGNMIGYNIFGPLYLLAVYVGLFVLSQQNTLLTGLKNAAWIDGFFGLILFYIIAAAIFVGGAGVAWKVAFESSSSLKERVTGWSAKIGMDEKSMFGLKSGAQQFAKSTGATAAYEGSKARAGNIVKKVTDRGDRYQSAMKARFEGGKAVESLKRKRIQEQMTKNKELGLSTSDLRKDLADVGSDKYFAAAKELLDRDELTPDEMKAYAAATTGVSASYKAAAQEAVNKKLRERAKEKKFKNVDEVRRSFAATDDDSKEKFLRDLKKNNILEYAQIVKDADVMTLATKIEGSSMTPEDILRNNLSKIDAESLGKAKELAQNNGWTVDAELDQRFDDLAAEKGNYYKLLDGMKNPAARTDAIDRINEIKREALAADIDKATKIAEAGAEANAEALVTAQERLEATREERGRVLAARTPVDYSI